VSVWRDLHGGDCGADAIDAQLHRERLNGRARRLHRARTDALPDGAFVLLDGAPWLVRQGELLRWTAAGYRQRAAISDRRPAQLLTPPSLVALLASGWRPLVPLVHPSGVGEPAP
jgi:hypothetical protein